MKFLVIFVIVLIGAKATLGSRACTSRQPQNLTSAQKLQYLRQHYMFVENKLVKRGSHHTQTSGRINLFSGQIEGSTYCPWTWAIDKDVDRIPRYLAKAECSGCNPFCRVVFYTHSTLVQRCDRTTGEIIWKRIEKTLEIAYVYDP